MEDVRSLGLVRAGPLRLYGMRGAQSREPRYAPDAYALAGAMTVDRAVWGDDTLELWCHRTVGQADVEEPWFELRFTRVDDALQPSPARTLRKLLGAYPGWSDRRRYLPGPGTIPIAALNP